MDTQELGSVRYDTFLDSTVLSLYFDFARIGLNYFQVRPSDYFWEGNLLLVPITGFHFAQNLACVIYSSWVFHLSKSYSDMLSCCFCVYLYWLPLISDALHPPHHHKFSPHKSKTYWRRVWQAKKLSLKAETLTMTNISTSFKGLIDPLGDWIWLGGARLKPRYAENSKVDWLILFLMFFPLHVLTHTQ